MVNAMHASLEDARGDVAASRSAGQAMHSSHSASRSRCALRYSTWAFAVVVILCVLPGSMADLKDTSKALAESDHRTVHHVKASVVAEQGPGRGLGDTDFGATAKHVAHAKALAMKRIGVKAEAFQTQDDVSDKENRKTASILPFLLPPIGLMVLTTIGCLVVGIRKWQKIPSMPTQGRMDISAVQESARAAGGIRSQASQPAGREMKHAWG